jgi:hypothetical protein
MITSLCVLLLSLSTAHAGAKSRTVCLSDGEMVSPTAKSYTNRGIPLVTSVLSPLLVVEQLVSLSLGVMQRLVYFPH